MDGTHGRMPKHPTEITVKHAKNGGFIVRHSFDNSGAGESYRMPEEHAFSGHKEMMAHLHKHTSHGASPAGVGRAITKAAPGPKSRGAGLD